jgi:hypothetical protein
MCMFAGMFACTHAYAWPVNVYVYVLHVDSPTCASMKRMYVKAVVFIYILEYVLVCRGRERGGRERDRERERERAICSVWTHTHTHTNTHTHTHINFVYGSGVDIYIYIYIYIYMHNMYISSLVSERIH